MSAQMIASIPPCPQDKGLSLLSASTPTWKAAEEEVGVHHRHLSTHVCCRVFYPPGRREQQLHLYPLPSSKSPSSGM